MCGIAGFTFDDGDDPQPRLDRMLQSMIARGPDGEGRFIERGLALGMRRLAIRDVAHGQQPFTSSDGEIVVFANGEIYNDPQLRLDLEGRGIRFETSCDTEVLPHAFRIWGPEEFPRRLDGMFGLAALDRANRELHLYRDRYGEKPLFYSHAGGAFRFASQLATLAQEPECEFDIDPKALRQYLALHYVTGSRTIVRDVHRVPPGHHLRLDLTGTRPASIESWIPSHVSASVPRTYVGAIGRVRKLLDESVRSRMISDVPLGVFLSGGLDSSAVAAIARRHVTDLDTFSVGFERSELDESRHASAVAEALGTRHHHFQFDFAACLDVFDEAIAALDEPVGDPACLPVHLLARESRKRVKVVLTGEGADEIFGGYAYYPEPKGSRRWRRFVRGSRGRFGTARSASPGSFFRDDNTTPSGFPMLSTRAERLELVPGATSDEDDWTRQLTRTLAAVDCDLARAQLADLHSWLPDDLLTKLDRMTMSASLEGRAPYLEPRLASLALAMPAAWKGDASERKRVLRDAVAPFLPNDIVERRKQGFVLPMQEWLLGPLRERLLDGLDGDPVDGLDLPRARRLVLEDLDRGASRSRLLYGLLAFREWTGSILETRKRARRSSVPRVSSERSEFA